MPLEEYQYKEKLELKDLDLPDSSAHKVSCPSCSQAVTADNLDLKTHVAKCGNCNVIFSFSDIVDKVRDSAGFTEVQKPEGISINQIGNDLEISVRQPWTLFELIGVSFAPVLFVLLTSLFIAFVAPTLAGKMVLVTFLVAALTAYISYFFIRKEHRLNVHIDDNHLYIEHRPKKLVKDKSYPIKDIIQIYTKNIAGGNNTMIASVFMVIKGKEGERHIQLIKPVSSLSQAKYIEQEIEKQLKISDRRVPDEVS